MGKYHWVWLDRSARTKLHDVGILEDGTLHNPNGYPEDVVRAAVLAADAQRHERHSAAAKKAAATRARRRELKINWIARRVAERQQTGPRSHCYVCGRGLGDPLSIERGIGSECWQDVLKAVERMAQKVDDLFAAE